MQNGGSKQSKENIVINSNAGDIRNSAAGNSKLSMHEVTTAVITVILIGVVATFLGKICKKWLGNKMVQEVVRASSREVV